MRGATVAGTPPQITDNDNSCAGRLLEVDRLHAQPRTFAYLPQPSIGGRQVIELALAPIAPSVVRPDQLEVTEESWASRPACAATEATSTTGDRGSTGDRYWSLVSQRTSLVAHPKDDREFTIELEPWPVAGRNDSCREVCLGDPEFKDESRSSDRPVGSDVNAPAIGEVDAPGPGFEGARSFQNGLRLAEGRMCLHVPTIRTCGKLYL